MIGRIIEVSGSVVDVAFDPEPRPAGGAERPRLEAE